MFCTSFYDALHLCDFFVKISESVFYRADMVEIAIFNIYYVERVATPKVG